MPAGWLSFGGTSLAPVNGLNRCLTDRTDLAQNYHTLGPAHFSGERALLFSLSFSISGVGLLWGKFPLIFCLLSDQPPF